jgi:hypothetical protein
VYSLIIPVVLLLLLGLWGVLETGRKFRTEFRRRGKSWDDLCAAMGRGEGLLVVDTIWGPQRGLGHPVIWWLPRALSIGDELGRLIETDAQLVQCPRNMRKAEALRERFGDEKVLLHGWAVGANLMPAGAKQDSA